MFGFFSDFKLVTGAIGCPGGRGKGASAWWRTGRTSRLSTAAVVLIAFYDDVFLVLSTIMRPTRVRLC